MRCPLLLKLQSSGSSQSVKHLEVANAAVSAVPCFGACIAPPPSKVARQVVSFVPFHLLCYSLIVNNWYVFLR